MRKALGRLGKRRPAACLRWQLRVRGRANGYLHLFQPLGKLLPGQDAVRVCVKVSQQVKRLSAVLFEPLARCIDPLDPHDCQLSLVCSLPGAGNKRSVCVGAASVSITLAEWNSANPRPGTWQVLLVSLTSGPAHSTHTHARALRRSTCRVREVGGVIMQRRRAAKG